MLWSASKLDRFCCHRHTLSELTPKPSRDKAAAKGKAFDAALIDWHKTGIVPAMADPDVSEWLRIMVEHGWAWPDGCELQVAWGLDTFGAFCAVEEKPADSHIYVPLDGMSDLLTAGRADVLWMSGDVLISPDWKSGRTAVPPARVNLQVNAAGIANAQRWKARAYQPAIYYAREGRWDVGEEVELGSDEHGEMLAQIEAAAKLDDKPHPGDHCASCWSRKDCSEAA